NGSRCQSKRETQSNHLRRCRSERGGTCGCSKGATLISSSWISWNKQLERKKQMIYSSCLLSPRVCCSAVTLTGVPPDRQKVLIKGLLKDDTDLKTLHMKEGQRIMLIGTSEGNEMKQPVKAPVFIEDLSVQDRQLLLQDNKIERLPKVNEKSNFCMNGMKNFGNTCFLNSVLQFLRPVSQLTEGLKSYSAPSPSVNSKLILALKHLQSVWNISCSPADVQRLVVFFRSVFPQLATTTPEGFVQQDAEQCLSALLNFLNTHLHGSLIDELFSISTENFISCMEDETEREEKSSDRFLVLPCHLSSSTSSIYDLYESIKISMESTIEKMSEHLGRNASYKKKSQFTFLPPFVLVQFVRFEWKKAQGLTKASRAKICRKVLFPSYLDLFDFCSEVLKLFFCSSNTDLQKEFLVGRKVLAARKDREVETAPIVPSEQTAPIMPPVESASQVSSVETAPIVPPVETAPIVPQEDTVSTPLMEIHDGKYELCSIVTHKGRTAERGHYVAWVKKDEDMWYMFDDENVTVQKWSSLDLNGGRSDYHIAYLCMYKRRCLDVSEEELALIKS
ncbi:ubiquitin carboxyl-terminal hydrolase, partial [Cardiosporidium cionae]